MSSIVWGQYAQRNFVKRRSWRTKGEKGNINLASSTSSYTPNDQEAGHWLKNLHLVALIWSHLGCIMLIGWRIDPLHPSKTNTPPNQWWLAQHALSCGIEFLRPLLTSAPQRLLLPIVSRARHLFQSKKENKMAIRKRKPTWNLDGVENQR